MFHTILVGLGVGAIVALAILTFVYWLLIMAFSHPEE